MTSTYSTQPHLDTKGVTVAFRFPTPQAAWICADYADPEVFSPVDDDALAQAQRVCSGCAVREICLDLGLSRDEWGVWGGVLLEGGTPIAQVRRPGRPPKATAC